MKMASADEAALLKSTVDFHGRSYLIRLTSSEIYWEAVSSSWASGGPYSQPLVKTENQTVKLSEIIAVKPEQKVAHSHKDGTFQNLEMVSLSATSFSLYVVRRVHRHKWRDRKVTFHCKDCGQCQQWIDKLQAMLAKPEFNRPKKLLVFVNPYGGKKKGPKIYREKSAPLFELAGVSTEVVVTNRQNHARDMLLTYDLSTIDGVVCVGGDGMFTELLHGVMGNTHRQAGIDTITPTTKLIPPAIRIGIIPAGSTDTTVYSVCGINDPITATLHIIVGDSISLDISTVHHGNQFLKYQFSLLGYGYFGDVIVDSEHHRWMGPNRYNWSGFKKYVSNRTYEGEISFIQSIDKENSPRDATRCKAGCTVCQAPVRAEEGTEGESPEVWQKIKGRFMAINCFTMSCRCEKCPEGTSPCAHLGDGHIDIVLVNACSRIDYFKFLYRCMDKKADQYDFPFVQVFRVKQFKFRPVLSEEAEDTQDDTREGQQRLRSRHVHNSVWNCDGEPIDEPALDVRVHRQVIKYFGRGVEEEVKEESATCMHCAGCVAQN